MTDVTVAALADLVGGRVVGDGQRTIVGLGDLRTAGADRIGFVRDAKYHEVAATTRVGAVIVGEELRTAAAQIVVADVDVAYAKVARHFHPPARAVAHRVHERASIDPAAQLAEPVRIDGNASIGRARIGRGTVVMSGAVVGDDCVIGEECILHANSTLYAGTTLGNRVIVHGGAVVGSDGFGYARGGASWIKVPQLGGTVIEDDVEIGAGCTIDRGTLGVTRIGAGTKIDNLCHIAHNCSIGHHVVMAAGVMIAGSTKVGDRCTLGGIASLNGHIEIAADTRIGGGSHVYRSIEVAGDYAGTPLLEKRQYFRLLRKLAALAEGRRYRAGAGDDEEPNGSMR